MDTPFGHCLCRRIRYCFDRDAAVRFLLCHCESCRRATAAPVAGFFTVRDTAWRWKDAAPVTYASGPGVTRGFCGTCGTPMFYRTETRPGETDFYAATLANPAEFKPASNAFYDEHLDWTVGIDALPTD